MMKTPKTAYEIRQAHDAEDGAFLVRKVKILCVYPMTETAGISTRINGREVRGFAKFANLASTKQRAASLLLARMMNFPDEKSAVSARAGAGETENQNRRPAACSAA